MGSLEPNLKMHLHYFWLSAQELTLVDAELEDLGESLITLTQTSHCILELSQQK